MNNSQQQDVVAPFSIDRNELTRQSPLMMSKIILAALSLLVSALLIASLGIGQVRAANDLDKPVAVYPIDCQNTFACPSSILPRVAFWVEVFSRWDTNTAIFHDKHNPQRVFSTVNRKEGCRRSRKGDSIDRERKRLKRDLGRLAEQLRQGQNLNAQQQKLYAVFDGASYPEVAAAANSIRCQSGNRDRMREALAQFNKYRPTILDALKQQNLTPELQYLPFVESAFNPDALSHVGAAGLWQIMPATGRRLGLQVDTRIDERYDPVAATYAAARYFRKSVDDLSETAFENGHTVEPVNLNPFVITSYNYGVRGMQRAIKQVGLDYERLLKEYKSPNFQIAVKNFYASFLAARYVAKNAPTFFGEIQDDRSLHLSDFNTIELQRATSAKRLSNTLGIDINRLEELNPALKQVIWKHKALIPKGYTFRLPYKESGYANAMTKVYALPREIERPGHTWHRVRSGETACGIAERYKASCSALKRLNGLNRKAVIYAGKRIKVPTRAGGITVAGAAKGSTPPAVTSGAPINVGINTGNPGLQSYRVKRGDTSCKIANRHGMLCNEFLALNGLNRQSTIRVGQQVRVSADNAWHLVRRGQTACGIAEQYGVRCSALLDANQLTLRSKIQIGQRLRIPSAAY